MEIKCFPLHFVLNPYYSSKISYFQLKNIKSTDVMAVAPTNTMDNQQD